jgi:hypothetical protein
MAAVTKQVCIIVHHSSPESTSVCLSPLLVSCEHKNMWPHSSNCITNLCRSALTDVPSIMIARYPERVPEWDIAGVEANMELVKDAIHGGR